MQVNNPIYVVKVNDGEVVSLQVLDQVVHIEVPVPSVLGPTGPAGADGATIIYGAVDPTTEGVDGDGYINTLTNTFFGPRAAGVWPAGVSLVGPAGPTGAAGAAGADGATGPTGPAGADGADGADGATGPAGPTGAAGVGFVAYGFGPRADSTLSFVDGTRTFSITPTSANFKVWVAGTEFTKTVAQTVVIADTPGWHYIYFDATGTIQETTTKDEALFKDNAIAAAVHWVNVSGLHTSISDRRHGYLMDRGTLWAMDGIHGLKMLAWPEALLSVDADGSLDLHAQVGINANSAVFADLAFGYLLDFAPTQWPIFHRDDAIGDKWVKDTATDFPVKRFGTGRLAINVYLSGWGQAEVPNGMYCWSHIYATTDPDMPYAVVQGIYEHESLAMAMQELGREVDDLYYNTIDGSFYPLPFEGALLMSLLYQTSDSMTNTVKAALRSVPLVGAGDSGFFNWTVLENHGVRSHSQLKDIGRYTHEIIDNFIDMPAVAYNSGTDKLDAQKAVTQPFGTETDVISELTPGAGVTIDGVLLKDGLVAWSAVDKTGSSLADLATKAHGALSDIGTNTHAQIDTHIADMTNPHEVNSDQVLGNGAENLLAVFGSGNTVNGWVYPAEPIQICFDGGGATLTVDKKGDYVVPFGMTIERWYMVADQTGSVEIGVWKDSYANFPPVVGDVLVSPSITSDVKNTAIGLSLSVAFGDILRFNVNSVTSIQRVTLLLWGKRSA